MTALALSMMTGGNSPDRAAREHAEQLARVAATKDRQAFAELFDHFAPRVKSFMMRKGATAEQAEDLVQETMIAVWSKAALYAADRGSVATWIFTIARNLRIDRLRREKSNQFTDLDDYDAPSDDPSQDETLRRIQEDGAVAKALAQIPPEQRELLILSYVEDMPQSEIAARLQIPLGTVKSRMRLAYRRMKKMLETLT
ncbi:sigma-70 family RNA polymerase sigma factor [Aestuariivirga sp.]|uniref:sigma-70 family RNA polymerase sigma factor n=1 Tax=Aestuariivirga sp. TaxID=2650926 RepID=UPI0039E31052